MTFIPGKFGNFDDRFCDELKTWIGGRRVLETFAGNGLLSSMLSARGVDIVATSVFSGHDAHDIRMYHDVVEMDSAEAVYRLGEGRDVLVMCWPTTVEATTRSALLWGDRPIVFIGEVTDHSLGIFGLGGCATDLFFDITVETETFSTYVPRGMLDRAAVRFIRPDAFDIFSERMTRFGTGQALV